MRQKLRLKFRRLRSLVALIFPTIVFFRVSYFYIPTIFRLLNLVIDYTCSTPPRILKSIRKRDPTFKKSGWIGCAYHVSEKNK